MLCISTPVKQVPTLEPMAGELEIPKSDEAIYLSTYLGGRYLPIPGRPQEFSAD